MFSKTKSGIYTRRALIAGAATTALVTAAEARTRCAVIFCASKRHAAVGPPPPPPVIPLAINSQESAGAGHNSTTSPLTWSFINAGGTLLVVGVTVNQSADGSGNPTIGAVTYGGQAMTLVPNSLVNSISGGGSNNAVALYYIVNPLMGTNTVSVTFSPGGSPSYQDCIAGAISFTGAGTPANAATAAGGSTAAAVNVPNTNSGSFVLGLVSTGASVLSATSPTTATWLLNVSGNDSGDNAALGQQNSTGGTTTAAFSVVGDQWTMSGIEIPAAPTSGGGGGGGAPPQAALAGFKSLVFTDEFTSLSTIDITGSNAPGFKWYTQCYYGGSPNFAAITQPQPSILQLATGDACSNSALASFSIANGGQGYAVKYGYFEARIAMFGTDNAGPGWPAWWLFSKQHMAGGGNGNTRWGSISVLEWFGNVAQTVHDYSTDGSVPNGNVQNLPDTFSTPCSAPSCGFDKTQFHIYGCLWTPGKIVWYLDNVPTIGVNYGASVSPTDLNGNSTDNGAITGTFSILDTEGSSQTMVLNLGTGPNQPMQIDWVHVWG